MFTHVFISVALGCAIGQSVYEVRENPNVLNILILIIIVIATIFHNFSVSVWNVNNF